MDSGRRDLLPPCLVEFRAPEDDAWYGVWLEMEEGEGEEYCLRVMYCNFPQCYDETFRTGSFKNMQELEEFRDRFRPTSIQMQDCECSKLKEGLTVCASFIFGESDVRFYDAVIQSVCSSEHKIIEDSEVCTCTFELLWQHGPNAGIKSTVCIENVCLLQDEGAQSDPQLDYFLELSRSKLQSVQHLLGFSVACSSKTPDDILKEIDRDENRKKVVKGYRYFHKRKAGHDIDFEFGDLEDNYQFIWIENLEKDLLPQNITDFLYRYTSILSQASVLPSSSSESFTRGIVYVDSKEKAMQLSYFLDNPSHSIISSRGRPWVIPEKQWSYGSAGGSISRYEKPMQSGMEDPKIPNNKIKVVDKGTQEYEKARMLHELFMEVHASVQDLHRKLASWESTLMQSS